MESVEKMVKDLRFFADALYHGSAAYETADPMHAQIHKWADRLAALSPRVTVDMVAALDATADKLRELDDRREARLAALAPAGVGECWCKACRPVTLADCRMVLCPTCGNKRCPRANDHRNACTGSNEPGQKGSAYEFAEAMVQVDKPASGSFYLVPLEGLSRLPVGLHTLYTARPDSVSEAAVERAAMALCDTDDCTRRQWYEFPEYGRDRYRDKARAALEAARAPGGVSYD